MDFEPRGKEVVIRDGLANRVDGWASFGWLTITDQRVVFRRIWKYWPGRFCEIEIPVSDIVSVSRCIVMGIAPNGVDVELDTGRVIKFQVFRAENIVRVIANVAPKIETRRSPSTRRD